MFRLPFKVIWSSNNIFSCTPLAPTSHTKYKVIDIAPSNKSVMTFKFPTTNFERILRRNKTARISGQSSECSDCPFIHIEQFLGTQNIENLYILDHIKV